MPTVLETRRVPILVWGPPPDAGDDGAGRAPRRPAVRLPPHRADARRARRLRHAHRRRARGARRGASRTPSASTSAAACARGKTNVTVEEFLPKRDLILSDIMRSVPTGLEWHKASQESRTDLFDDVPDVPALLSASSTGRRSRSARSAAATTSSSCSATPRASCGRWCTPARATSASRWRALRPPRATSATRPSATRSRSSGGSRTSRSTTRSAPSTWRSWTSACASRRRTAG